MPLQRWSWDEVAGTEDSFAGAAVVSVTPERLKQIAEIEHPDGSDADCPECGWWTAPIMRSLVIGDVLYTVSETGILASDMDSYEPMEWITF